MPRPSQFGVLIRTPPFVTAIVLLALSLGAVPSNPRANGEIAPNQTEFFETRIRPVLIEHCYACHNSADNQEGELALDDRAGLLRGGAGGKIVIPGNPENSRLIAILKHEIDGMKMPEDGPKLDDQVIADFEKWIRMGSPDPRDKPPSAEEIAEATSWPLQRQRRMRWWSWQQISTAPPPNGPGTPIDRFIVQKLNANGLEPSPPADSTTLVRRLYYTLIGLPPTVSELEHWLKRFDESNRSEQTVNELIDHLLGSVHFGERWARHWMDWIRYAESHGSEGDPAIDNAWLYRDYLIRALNADVPYDTLVREHIAGDLLTEPRINESLGINESMIGPTHWRMVFHGFAPTDALDEKVRFIDDQINVFSKAFLGLTVSCARCHDHKFDAISQKDYYALFGILASCRPGRQVIDLPGIQLQHADALRQLKMAIRKALASDWLALEATTQAKLEQIAGDDSIKRDGLPQTIQGLLSETAANAIQDRWQKLASQRAEHQKSRANAQAIRQWDFTTSKGHQDWYRQELGLQSGPSKPGDFNVLTNGESAIQSVYPSGTYSHSLTTKHAARLTSPDFIIGENQEVWIHAIGDRGAATRYVIQDYPRNGTVYPVQTLKPKWSWQRYDLNYWAGDSAHLELTTAKDAPLLTKNEEGSWFGIREVRITKSGQTPPQKNAMYLDALLECSPRAPTTSREVKEIVWKTIRQSLQDWAADSCSDAQADFIDQCLQSGLLSNALRDLKNAQPLIAKYRELELSIITPTRVPGLDETEGRTQALFIRGNHKRPAENVPRRFLEAIDPTPYHTTMSGREKLADDVLRHDNPLTRRVVVNRVWHHLFGQGIVGTPDNFGRLGQQPSHPELLDWLATQFERDGWSLKSLIRSIVTTQTWQQTSTPSATAKRIDPNNKWLSHAHVRRNEAESIRDALLVASGQLDRTVSGQPVNGETPRRSIYVRVIRNRLDPFLRAFDFPEPFSTTGRRDVTNVPAQSLTMMNDAQVMRHASKLAESVIREDQFDTEEARVAQLFLTTFSRPPTNTEIEFAKQFLQNYRTAIKVDMSEIAAIRQQIAALSVKRNAILAPAREELLSAKTKANATLDLKPISRWDFDRDLRDSVGVQHGIAHGGASVEDGFLVLNSGGYVTTPPITRPITAKTLEAWVSIDDLGQRGGGVLTVQTSDGVTFDSIVFGEQEPQRWLAGSNNFKRTESFRGAREESPPEEFVHVAIAYHSDGRIIGYRNGEIYGESYKRGTPVSFPAKEAIISFGVRHLPAGGNRLFRGRIDRATLYDRALSEEEVAASFSNEGRWISQTEVIESLSTTQAKQLTEITEALSKLNKKMKNLGPVPERFDEQASWTDLTRTLLTLKEFIYVR